MVELQLLQMKCPFSQTMPPANGLSLPHFAHLRLLSLIVFNKKYVAPSLTALCRPCQPGNVKLFHSTMPSASYSFTQPVNSRNVPKANKKFVNSIPPTKDKSEQKHSRFCS